MVPELTQSSGAAGSRRPCRPTPSIDSSLGETSSIGDAQAAQDAQRGLAVAAGQEVAHVAAPLGQRSEHGRAVRDGLVAGNGGGTVELVGGVDEEVHGKGDWVIG